MDYFNKEGHLNDEAVSLWADAIKFDKLELLPNEIDDHLKNCEKCQHDVIDFAAIMQDVDQGILKKHPFFDKVTNLNTKELTGPSGNNIRSLIFRLIAVAVIGLLLILGYQQFSEANHQQEIVDKQEKEQPSIQKDAILEENKKEGGSLVKDADKEKVKPIENKKLQPSKEKEIIGVKNRDLFAANYIPNEAFESMIGATFRSEDFEIERPKDRVVFSKAESILFKWKDNLSLKLIILDNQEMIKFAEDIEGNQYNFNSSLQPGIYYWKLETENDLLHLGTFEIE